MCHCRPYSNTKPSQKIVTQNNSITLEIVPVTQFEQNCSVLVCQATKKAVAIDPGGDLSKVEAAIARLGAVLEKVFLTHGHIDHCGQSRALADRYKVPLEGPHLADKFWIDQLPEQGKMFGFPPLAAFDSDRWLVEGDTVSFGEQTMSVHHCPGHTPGHVVFFHAQAKLAIVGDVLFAGSIGRTDFPMGNHGDLISSIKSKLWPMGNDVAFVPGHGRMSRFGQERQSNPYVADALFSTT
jgi:hydroxyacylglutathione hydrolase